jgi:2-iminobutanoate/2-iminopropanoate deaminase
VSALPFTSESAPAAAGPYSHAAIGGGLLFVSGQLPTDPTTGELLTGSAAAQARQALANAKAVLADAGLGTEDVVKVTIFVTDLAGYAEVNATYAEAFGDSRPARSVVQVAALPRGAGVEVEMIAALDTGTPEPGQP